MRLTLLTTILLAALTLGGCALHAGGGSDLIATSHDTADRLVDNLKQTLDKETPILVTCFANIDNLEASSTFGRIMAEQVGSRLSALGYTVKELRMGAEKVYVRKQMGEFALSRDVKALSAEHAAQAVVVGTYGAAKQSVYVSARIVDATNDLIISSTDTRLAMDEDLRRLVYKSLFNADDAHVRTAY